MPITHRRPLGHLVVFAIALCFITSAIVVVVHSGDAPRAAAAEVGMRPVGPARLVDTRVNLGITGVLGARDMASFDVGDVPAGSAVVLNVTATQPTQPSFLTLWPSGVARPATSNVNFLAGQTVANLVMVEVGDDGRVSVYNRAGSTHVVVDIFGVVPAAAFTGAGPDRLVDTRVNLGIAGALDAGESASFDVGDVPAGSAVVLNVTATQPTQPSFLTLWPSGVARPATSNVNFLAGQTVANLVMVEVGDDGRVSVYNRAGSTDVVVDIFGVVPAAAFTGVGPDRLVDTRVNLGIAGALDAGESASFDVGDVPAGSAVVLNVTATQPTQPSFLTLWPSGVARPATSNVNFLAGQTVANLVMVEVGDDGRVSVYNRAGSTDVVVDILGWMPSVDGVWVPPTPTPTSTFLETFDGETSAPLAFSSDRWDVRRNITDYQKWGIGQSMEAQHGSDCAGPPATHTVANWMTDGVFRCRNHMMTAINADSYGATILTPAVQIDFANGGTISFDVSTLVMSGRDWIDLWVTPQADLLVLACGGKCPEGAYDGGPRNAVHLEKDGPQWNINVISDFSVIGSGSFREVGEPSPTIRTSFELRLTPSSLRFGTPLDGRFVSVQAPIPFTRAMVQWAHHSYNPTKDDSGVPATWHWDNFRIAPSVDMPIIKATNERVIAHPGDVRTIRFDRASPSGARLAFNAVCKVELDTGSGFVGVERMPGSRPGGAETSHSYLHTLPAGTTSVRVRFQGDDWYDGFPCLFEDPVILSR